MPARSPAHLAPPHPLQPSPPHTLITCTHRSASAGELSPAEFSELLRVVHLAEGDPPSSEAQTAAVFGRTDLNRNGRIDFNEFLRFHATYMSVQLVDLRRAMAQTKGGAG